LGAGNCNDLDLPELTRSFDEVHLLDLDAEALEFGVSNQGLSADTRVHLHGNVDVTGVYEALQAWSQDQQSAALEACVSRAQTSPVPALNGPFDVVASVCLLTQITESIALTIGERHPRFPELMLAVRDRHLRLLAEMVGNGGHICLVTDVVSSLTYPPLPTVPEDRLAETLSQLIQQRNFFSGVNPFVLQRYFASHPDVCRHLERVEVLSPWLWNFGPRVYAVCAIRAQRKPLVRKEG
jgi:hypothetical protein